MTEILRRFVGFVDELVALPVVTAAALILTLAWFIVGPRVHFSTAWQLFMTTTSAVVTFLMVFIIASAQKRNTNALHLKIDMLVAAHPELTNKAVGVEHAPDEHIAEVRQELAEKLADDSEKVAQESEKLADRSDRLADESERMADESKRLAS